MEKKINNVFAKSTDVISIILAVLGGAGILITPENTIFIVVAISIVIVFIIINEKFNQIDENKIAINELNKKLDLEKRLNSMERVIYEQKGKISLMEKRWKTRKDMLARL